MRTAVALFVCVLGLSACGGVQCPPKGFESAASHWELANSHLLPANAWTKNPKLEAFLKEVIQAGGVASLRTTYGMQCFPRASSDGCADCYACSKTFPGKRLAMASTGSPLYGRDLLCVDDGEMFVKAEIGPGSAISAMSFWKK